MAPTPVLLPGKSHGRGAWWATVHVVPKSQTRLGDFTFTFLFHALEKEMATHSCSCLENPRDRGAWWAAVCGVTQSLTRLKRLSSSSSSLGLLQGIFPTQGSSPGLLHCRRILYQLSHQGSPRILEWVAYPFSRGSSWPRNWTQVSHIAAKFEFLDTPPIF